MASPQESGQQWRFFAMLPSINIGVVGVQRAEGSIHGLAAQMHCKSGRAQASFTKWHRPCLLTVGTFGFRP
jgi:hypothetical protein